MTETAPEMTPVEAHRHLHALTDAMVSRSAVLVLTELRNGAGEITKEPGWRSKIREIRRPAEHEAAYGHLEPVVVIEGDPDDPDHGPGLSICLQVSQVTVDPWCGCSDPEYCRRSAGIRIPAAR